MADGAGCERPARPGTVGDLVELADLAEREPLQERPIPPCRGSARSAIEYTLALGTNAHSSDTADVAGRG